LAETIEPVEFGEAKPVGTKKQFIVFLTINMIIGLLLWFLLKDYKQTLAGTIFLATVIGTLMFWRFRLAIAFIGIVLLLLTRTIDLHHAIEFMSMDVIVFLVGMMIVVGVLRRSGFFRWLLSKGLQLSGFRPNLLMLFLLFLSSLTASLVDEVTSILFVTALVLELCDFFKVKPVNYIISVVLATNIGSSWTVLGNPIGILIALRSGLTFEDFMTHAFPIGLLSLASLMIIILLWQRGDLHELGIKVKASSPEERKRFLSDLTTVKDKRLFTNSSIIFIGVITFLALHYRLELLLGLEHNTLLVGASICGAGIVMLWQRAIARELVMKEVDWWTLVFLMFLFAKAGTIKYVGLTETISKGLLALTAGGGAAPLMALMLWLSGATSAAIDNVVVVAVLIPVIQDLTPVVGSMVLWWALLFGGCYGGNMTMVGSTANIVALGILEAKKGYYMTLRYWAYIGLLGSLVPMTVATLALLLFI
jgi:Na+/H+ antiporter NhaD/arsenite permease-like protein